MTPEGIYLLQHATGLYLYAGPGAPEERVVELYGAPLPSSASALPTLDTDFSARVSCVVACLRGRHPDGLHVPLTIVRHDDKAACEGLIKLLVEDKVGASPSYVDVLCDMHTAILERLPKT